MVEVGRDVADLELRVGQLAAPPPRPGTLRSSGTATARGYSAVRLGGEESCGSCADQALAADAHDVAVDAARGRARQPRDRLGDVDGLPALGDASSSAGPPRACRAASRRSSSSR